jgi:IMP dehydrogenase
MAKIILPAMTFDDVLLEPGYSNVLPNMVNCQGQFSRNIKLNIPLVSAAMDTVTEHAMAIAMAEAGGIGVIHKNLSHDDQAREVAKVKRYVSGMVVNPITITQDQSLATVRELMQEHAVSGIPVVEPESNKLVGIITYRDVRFAKNPHTLVKELMTTSGLVTVSGDVSHLEARDLLHKHRIEKLIVVDENYACVGLITFRDIDRAQTTPLALKDLKGRLMVAAAVGVSDQELARAQALVNAGVDALVVDTAHGHTQGVGDQVYRLKQAYPNLDVVAGNIATAQAAEFLYKCGADGLKVGIGPGCFVPGMPVVTQQGTKPIEQVEIGDKVLTHTGSWKPVTNLFTFNDKKEIIHINDIICTPNHEFFVLHKQYQNVVTDDNIHDYAEWIEAKNLSMDYLLIKHNLDK